MSGSVKLVDGALVPLSPEELAQRALEEAAAPVLERRMVPKLLIVDRLHAAGLLRNAAIALGIGQAPATLTDQQLRLRERFAAAVAIAADDPDAIALITEAGGSPAVILAPP